MERCNRFRFAMDMNGDLSFTISDVALLAKQAFLLPSKLVSALVHANSGLAKFFEISCATGEGWGGAIFSFFAWLLVLGLIGAIAETK